MSELSKIQEVFATFKVGCAQDSPKVIYMGSSTFARFICENSGGLISQELALNILSVQKQRPKIGGAEVYIVDVEEYLAVA